MTRKVLQEFYHGLKFWLSGWKFIFQNRTLLALAAIPFCIVLLAAGSLGWVLWHLLPGWVQHLIGWIGVAQGAWHKVLYYPMLASLTLLVFISSLYVIYLLHGLIAIPFYAILADRSLGLLDKKLDDRRMWREWAKNTLRMIRISLLKTLILLLVGIVLFVFSFLPVLNVLAICGALLILASDCMDYTLEALGYGLRQRFAYFFRNWAQWLGMAAGLALTLLVPGLTLLVIPGAVVGAALIVKNERSL